jgi:hypothetical protein
MHSSDHSIAVLITFGLIVLGAYFLPSLIANGRRHHNTNAITVTNIFFGWTVLGWLICLIWSFTNKATPPTITRNVPSVHTRPTGAEAAELKWPQLVEPSLRHQSNHVDASRWMPRRFDMVPILAAIAVFAGIGGIVWALNQHDGQTTTAAASSHQESIRSDAPPVSQPLNIASGSSSDTALMTALFPRYDASSKSVRVSRVRSSATAGSGESQDAPFGDAPGILTMVSRADIKTSLGLKRLVLFRTVPDAKDSFDCHVCAPVLGYALLQQKAGEWSVVAFDPFVAPAGSWGELPKDITWLGSGPNTAGLLVHQVEMHQGVQSESFELIHPSGPHSSVVLLTWNTENSTSVALKLVPVSSGPDRDIRIQTFHSTEQDSKASTATSEIAQFHFDGRRYVSNAAQAPPEIANGAVNGSSLSPSSDRDPVEKAYIECLTEHVNRPNYTSFDGGRSAILLMARDCKIEWHAQLVACQKNDHLTEGQCNLNAGILAQSALKLSGK